MSTPTLRPPLQAGRTESPLLPIEWITLGYTLFTSLLILLCYNDLSDPVRMWQGRLWVAGGTLLFWLLGRLFPGELTRLLRSLFPLGLLGYWYPDTYDFCQLLPNLDHFFAGIDHQLFGCQPALTFSHVLPGKLWSELFHLGYFSYYPLIFLTALAPLAVDRRQFEPTAFVIMGGFLLYYLIYLFLPVAGPQYYFCAVDPHTVHDGLYPALGDYFRSHTELRPSPGPEGLFRHLVELTQAGGERPTAAFPSSHVGMSTILMLLLWQGGRRRLFCVALPFYLLLCGATVYIEAHYLIDVFGGLLSAVAFYPLLCRLYRRMAGAAADAPLP